MKIIPDLDSIIIEYQIDDKEKLLKVLKEKILGYSNHWHYSFWTRKLQNPVICYENHIFFNSLTRNRLNINSPALIEFPNNTLFNNKKQLVIHVKPARFLLVYKTLYVLVLWVFLFLLSSFGIKLFIRKEYAGFFILIFTMFPLLIGFLLHMFYERYSNYRTISILAFENFMSDNGIKFTKIKETRQKPW